MQRLRNNLLSRAMLARDKHVGVRGPYTGNQFQGGTHDGRFCDQGGTAFRPQEPILGLQALSPPQRTAQVDLRPQDGQEAGIVPGLLEKSRAPRRMVSTANSTLPHAVITTTGSVLSSA